MLAADNREEALRQAEGIPYLCITHFHDPEKRAGKAIADAMSAPGRVAWDIYMIFRPGILWGEAAPRPDAWVHQLAGAQWANPLHYRTGRALKRELSKLILGYIEITDYH